MFGFMKKLKGAMSQIANSSVKAENKDIMEAMVASAALVAYADGELSVEEMTATRNIIGSSAQLTVFGDEPMQTFDKYCGKMEASARMGKLDLMKEITDVAGEEENSQRVLIMAIEVADAEGGIGEAEMKMLETIAGKLSLRLSDFI